MADKTNAMRILEREKIPYARHDYGAGEGFTDGLDAAKKLNEPPERVFKTLVTALKPGNCFVFVIPVERELDLKAAAKASGVKALSLVHVKDLTALTGYVRGGCSPIGMKKNYPTVFDESALLYPTVFISAGKIGCQIEADPSALIAVSRAKTAPLTAD